MFRGGQNADGAKIKVVCFFILVYRLFLRYLSFDSKLKIERVNNMYTLVFDTTGSGVGAALYRDLSRVAGIEK